MCAKNEFEQFVVPCYVQLVEALHPSLLLDHLRQARLIDGPEYRELQAASEEEDRSRKLLNDILPRKEKGAYRKFCEVLLAVKDQKYIVASILATRPQSFTVGTAVGTSPRPSHLTAPYPPSN